MIAKYIIMYLFIYMIMALICIIICKNKCIVDKKKKIPNLVLKTEFIYRTFFSNVVSINMYQQFSN